MEIKKRLWISSIISLCTVFLILLSLICSFRVIYIADQKIELIDEMRKAAFDRILLRDEYLLYQGERAKAQWYAKSKALQDLFAQAETRFDLEKDKTLLKNARKDFNATFSGFTRVIEAHPPQDSGPNTKVDFSDAESPLISQVFLKAYSLNDNIDRLHESVHKASSNARNRGAFIIVVVIFGGLLVLIINSSVIRRTLAERIEGLNKGFKVIGDGDHDYRITLDGDDELTDLAQASNEMAAKLKASYTSVENLNKEIAERKHLEAQLRHSQKMEAVGALAGGVAHDFNNILNVIMGYGGMVLDNLESGSSSREDMNTLLAAAERAADLTRRLLVFSRNQVPDVKPVNINELILNLRKMLIRIISESIEFHLNLADNLLIVQGDAGMLEQVLINLANNAGDAMPEGGRLSIGTCLKEMNDEYIAIHGYGKAGKYALITISDTGPGMNTELQKRIFEPFFTTKGVGGGTGLGLAISYGIIKQHDGYINVFSKSGYGTIFKIFLPLSEGETSLVRKTDTASVMGGNETILVAEDDAEVLKLSRRVLESFGYNVISAQDGEDAITKFMENREHVSLLLLEMIMPKKNGKEVAEAIRKVSPLIKILFASGYTSDIIKTTDLTAVGFDFIRKPYQPRDLVLKIREVLDK
jgi:signal transduction histidine kinase